MLVKDLTNFFQLDMDEMSLTRILTSISHWVRLMRKSGDAIEITTTKDLTNLKKLEELKIIEIKKDSGTTRAILTKDGRELYLDFFKHGYYEGGI